MEPEITVLCANCSLLLDEDLASPDRTSRACPGCGDNRRLIEVRAADEVRALDRLAGALNELGVRHWTKKFVSGEEYYQAGRQVHTVIRVMDWKNRHDPDSYYELITNTGTGEVVRTVAEALVDHQSRGAAKRTVPEFPDEWRRVAAYYIWQKEGCPHGRHVNHWNAAKAELKRLWKAGLLPPFVD
ncbi:MAG: DUF2934 domain-containing protein [Candidatus Binatia bacterium]|jgi:hypothetical protein